MSEEMEPTIIQYPAMVMAHILCKSCDLIEDGVTLIDTKTGAQVDLKKYECVTVRTPDSGLFIEHWLPSKNNFNSGIEFRWKNKIDWSSVDGSESALLEKLAVPMYLWMPAPGQDRRPKASPIMGLWYSSGNKAYDQRLDATIEWGKPFEECLTYYTTCGLMAVDMRLRLRGVEGGAFVWGSKLATGEYVYSIVTWPKDQDSPFLMRYSRVHPLLMYYCRRNTSFLEALQNASGTVAMMFINSMFDVAPPYSEW